MKVVYFVRNVGGEAGHIKIGKTANLSRRLAQLSDEHGPVECLAIVEDAGDAEREHHQRFADFRIAGEWFRAEPELTGYIKALAERLSVQAEIESSARDGFAGRQLRLPPELWEALDAIADMHERSANTELMRMLRRASEAHQPEACPECAAKLANPKGSS